MDRRRFLSTLLATAGAAFGLTGTGKAAAALLELPTPRGGAPDPTEGPTADRSQPRAARPAPPVARAVDRLPLPLGARVGDCVVDTVGECRCGVIPVVLRDRAGQRFQVDVARREFGGPSGIGNTRRLSLYLVNGGSGRTPTDEAHGLAVMALASRLARLERSGVRWPALLSLRERAVRHPDGIYQIC